MSVAPTAIKASGYLPSSAQSRPMAPVLERRLFWSLVALTILPVWTTTYFPAQDGPIHLYIVHLLDAYLWGGAGFDPAYFEINTSFEPNLAFYAFGLSLAQFIDLLIVEKLYITAVAIALCLAVRHAIAAINPAATVLGLLVVPTAFHYFVHMGFYNYSLGVVAALLGLGFCVRRLEAPGPRDLVLMGLVFLAVFAVHLMGFMVLGLGIGTALFWHWIDELRRDAPLAETLRSTLRRALLVGLAAAPSLAFALDFFVRNGVSRTRPDDIGADGLASMITLVSFERTELWLVAPWLALFYALVVYTLVRHWRAGTLWQSALVGLLPLLLVIVFFVNPVSTRRIALADRFLPFIVPLTIIWIATLTPSRSMARLVAAVAIVTTLATAGFRLWIYDRHDASIQRYLAAASAMTPGRALLPLHLELEDGSRDFAVMPLIHASAHLARERDLAYLRGSLLSRSVYGYFPVVYRAEADPYRHLSRWLDDVPPEVELRAYEAATSNRLDYLLVWPMPAVVPGTPSIAALLTQVEAGWRPVPLPPEASVSLFERQDDGRAVPPQRTADEASDSGARR